MIELLIGTKGTGKTKVLIENVNSAAKSAEGNVVFISNNTSQNMYNITSKVRMADTSEFDISSWDEFLGFICGIISGNFDITNVFVDGTLKIVNNSLDGFEAFLNSLDALGKKFDINFELSVSVDKDAAPEYIKKYVK
ncbi:MAG: twitching motility protein PilT [Ruminococcaceae bacterium]|nr:twitching motility protein PilT [Oscillospiraceae bacterium]